MYSLACLKFVRESKTMLETIVGLVAELIIWAIISCGHLRVRDIITMTTPF